MSRDPLVTHHSVTEGLTPAQWRAWGNKEYQTNLFTIHSQCISQNVRKIKIAIGLLHATCSLHRNVYISKLNRVVLLTSPRPSPKS